MWVQTYYLPLWMIIFSSFLFALALSTIFWSIVFPVTIRYTITGLVCPILCARSCACRSAWGFCKKLLDVWHNWLLQTKSRSCEGEHVYEQLCVKSYHYNLPGLFKQAKPVNFHFIHDIFYHAGHSFETRMHSSRMRTVRWGAGGCVCLPGGCTPLPTPVDRQTPVKT